MVYNYTKPRGPVAAMYSSPGPVYKLPSLLGSDGHDITHPKAPAYGFGSKFPLASSECSPGPCYLPESKLTNKGMETSCQFSIHSRPKDLSMFANPGPQAYSTVKAYEHLCGTGLSYTFGLKHSERKGDNVPAPNIYQLDSMLGKTVQSNKNSGPSYSLTGRSKIGGFDEDLKKTPGPGAYNIPNPSTYKDCQPKWSVFSRHLPPEDNTKKPSPCAYNPDNVEINHKAAPKFSFGIKHSQYKGEYITDDDLQ